MTITSNQNNNTVFGNHRNDVQVYADLESGMILFKGNRVRVSSRPVGTLLALEGSRSAGNRPRVAIKRTDITKENGDPWFIFSNRPSWFFFDRDGNRITSGTDAATQNDQLITYLNRQFSGEFIDGANFVMDDTGSLVTVYEGTKSVAHHQVNSLFACADGTTIKIISKGNPDEVIYDGLLVSTTKLNGTLVNGVLSNAINELNGAFTQTSSFLSSAGNPVVSGTVTGDDLTLSLADGTGVTIDVSTLNVDTGNSVVSGEVSGTNLVLTMTDSSTVTIDIQTLIIGQNPTYPGENWYYAFGTYAGEQLVNNRLYNNRNGSHPAYFGTPLAKGREFVWTYSGVGNIHMGVWAGNVNGPTGSTSGATSNWSLKWRFKATDNLITHEDASDTFGSVGSDINTRYSTGYALTPGTTTLAIRYMQNDKLGLFDLTNGSNILIAQSNNTFSGDVTLHATGQTNQVQAQLPYFVNREDVFEFAHRGTVNSDGTGGLDTDWRDGTEQRTILKTIQTLQPGTKFRWNINYTGTNQYRGLGYTGASTGESDPTLLLTHRFRYGATEQFYQMPDWNLNTSATGYNSSLPGYGVANGTPIGEVEIRYVDANTVTMWSVTNGERIATLDSDPGGLDLRLFFGRIQYDTGLANLPIPSKIDINPVTSPSSHKPDVSGQDLNTTEGASVYYTLQKDTNGDAVTMWAADNLPSWLLLNQTTGVLLGTAPTWTGTPGSGVTNDTAVTVRAANPFGVTEFTLTVKVGESGQSTNWTKAYEFDSSSDYMKQSGNSNHNNPLRKNVSKSAGQPWVVATVFEYTQESQNHTLWAQSEGAGGSAAAIKLQINNHHKLWFRHGSDVSNDQEVIATDVVPSGFVGVIVKYDGLALDASTLGMSGETAEDRFEIQYVDLETGVVTDVEGTWTENGNGSDTNIGGDYTVGALYSTAHVFNGKIASNVVTTNTVGYTMQDAEKAMMVRDPISWLNDYRVDEDWRKPDETSTRTGWAINHTDPNDGSHATKVFLMGDGTNDSFPDIYDQTCNTINTQRLVANNMVSTQVVNVTIPGLS